jgi:hypothetical protein
MRMSKPGLYGKLKFCPRCGVAALQRDDRKEKRSNFVEYLCSICCFGFRVSPSVRVVMAENLFKENRQVRVGNFYENVPKEGREAFELNYPEPWKFKLWRLWRRIQGMKQDTQYRVDRKGRIYEHIRADEPND